MRICNENENISSIKGLWELMTKLVTRRENDTQSILVTILRLQREPSVKLHLSIHKTKKMRFGTKLIN